MNNKFLIIIILLILVLATGTYFFVNNKSQMQTSTTNTNTQQLTGKAVDIKNFAFAPATITVKVGDSISWTNNDSMPHSASSDNGSFDTGILQTGQSKSITFTKAGTFTYHCSVHGSMKGTVIVQ